MCRFESGPLPWRFGYERFLDEEFNMGILKIVFASIVVCVFACPTIAGECRRAPVRKAASVAAQKAKVVREKKPLRAAVKKLVGCRVRE